ncbi:DUF2939 domain-containing protein [Sphingomonas sp. KR3-1]|uniref:DUF2939 domain-containing protein n=1 Tax=Sphingomonas sp. KR3-1 TaxID=3156611 RepID=UPI0032B57A74
MKRWLIALLVVAVLVVGGWIWQSPRYTLWQMKHAAEARDVDALATHVDFDAVRASVKEQLSGQMRGSSEGGGVLGALVRAGIADTVVDAAVSREGIRFIFAAAPLAESERPTPIKLKASEMRYRRVALDHFELTRSDGAALVFRLRGLRWTLVDVRLPPGVLH